MRQVTFGLVALLPSLVLGGAAGAETWLKDPVTGCEIWSPEASDADETATWTGACRGGKADGRPRGPIELRDLRPRHRIDRRIGSKTVPAVAFGDA